MTGRSATPGGLDPGAVLAVVRDLKARLDALEDRRYEPLAIVGIGCRLPGGVHGPEEFWEFLRDGTDAVREVPADRWDAAAYYDPDPATPGRMPVRHGAFLDGVDLFDPAFFGISPREAERLDPQQRLFLEVAWEALEDAGRTRESLCGSATGVFVGANSADYLQLQLAEPERVDTYTIVGGVGCIIANRLSYLLDLRGPSLTVDTACSSSLVATHLACRSLRSGEVDLAVVGGLNLILSPVTTLAHAKGLPLAADGRCKTFDARADGYVRGEGVLAVVLKRLSDAHADGDPVWAVVRGSAVNQDGLSNGLTAPNGPAQQAVITRALADGRVDPAQVGLVEAHGTGTSLGDPIEVEALREIYGERSAADDRCALVSVKTNLGHLEAGAGLAGLVKTALSIAHRAVPPHLHLEAVNPLLALDGSRLFVPTSLLPWDVPDERRLGAVSAFGAGGTNAHAVLGPAAPDPGTGPRRPDDEPMVLPISAASVEALPPTVRRWRDHLGSPAAGEVRFRDLARSATTRRTALEHRCAVVAGTAKDAADRLGRWLDHEAPDGVLTGTASAAVGRRIAFVFPGQGSQRAGMGRDLMEHCPAFRAAVLECDEAMREWSDRSVVTEVLAAADGTPVDRIELIQPALFALGVGLAARYRSFGIEPDAVIGHSMGEVAAAYVAGALDLRDATRVICRRSDLLRKISGQGAMLVVGLPRSAAAELVAERADLVSVAVSNSPTSTVLSGDAAVLAELARSLTGRKVFCRPVKVDVASHSPQVDGLREELLAELDGLRPRPGSVPIVSSVTGEVVDGAGFDAGYWVDNLRQPVLFWEGARALVDSGHGVFVELSAHPLLLTAVEQAFEDAAVPGLALPSMRRDAPARPGVAEVAAALWAHGLPAPLERLWPADARPARLPVRTWRHERFWFRDEHPPRPTDAPVAAPVAAAAWIGEPPRTAPAGTPDLGPDPGAALTAMVARTVAAVLKLEPARLDPTAGFFQLGMDSMLAAQVRARLAAELDLALPATVMFEHPTVTDLAVYLVAQVTAVAPAPAATSPATGPVGAALPAVGPLGPAPDHRIDDLTEDELLTVLAEELADAGPAPDGVR